MYPRIDVEDLKGIKRRKLKNVELENYSSLFNFGNLFNVRLFFENEKTQEFSYNVKSETDFKELETFLSEIIQLNFCNIKIFRVHSLVGILVYFLMIVFFLIAAFYLYAAIVINGVNLWGFIVFGFYVALGFAYFLMDYVKIFEVLNCTNEAEQLEKVLNKYCLPSFSRKFQFN
jgi:predicted histidine transporter YuiF (NhaC family)